MVYLVGLGGLIGGFMAGQLLLLFLLRHRSRRDLLTDRSIRWTYGLVNWAVAGLGVWLAVSLYNRYVL
jgi:hypothetical protein